MVPLILKKSNDDNYKKNCILKCYILFNIYFLINLNLFQKKKAFQLKKCYQCLEYPDIRINHLIITRFLMFFNKTFSPKIYTEDYIKNGIRVMKKYLFPSLDNQSCKNFTWILILGDKANITYVKSLLNFNISFPYNVLFAKSLKNYIRNSNKDFDVLITTRIDYDDRIYYDAVNDVRKAININRPIILYGYNRGVYYSELDNKYYNFDLNCENGTMSIFISLITVLNKINDTYTVYDLKNHENIRKTLLEKYKSFGMKTINYDPAIFDNGDPKFVYVRQNYSWYYSINGENLKRLKEKNFNLLKFYGK